MSSPVAGFRPLRSFLFLTQNFPNPLMRTLSPDSMERFMASSMVSMISADLFFGNPVCFESDSIISALVSVMQRLLLGINSSGSNLNSIRREENLSTPSFFNYAKIVQKQYVRAISKISIKLQALIIYPEK
jgi:hypothetical protein